MELWIRSQDKKYLENVKRIEIFCNEFDGDYYIQTSHTTLGSYETGERAIEILDDIQNMIIAKEIYINDREAYAESCDGFKKDEIKGLLKRMFVYEMPKE